MVIPRTYYSYPKTTTVASIVVDSTRIKSGIANSAPRMMAMVRTAAAPGIHANPKATGITVVELAITNITMFTDKMVAKCSARGTAKIGNTKGWVQWASRG